MGGVVVGVVEAVGVVGVGGVAGVVGVGGVVGAVEAVGAFVDVAVVGGTVAVVLLTEVVEVVEMVLAVALAVVAVVDSAVVLGLPVDDIDVVASEVVLVVAVEVVVEVIVGPRPGEVVELVAAKVGVEGVGIEGVCAETGTTVESTTAIGRPNISTRRRFISKRYAKALERTALVIESFPFSGSYAHVSSLTLQKWRIAWCSKRSTPEIVGVWLECQSVAECVPTATSCPERLAVPDTPSNPELPCQPERLASPDTPSNPELPCRPERLATPELPSNPELLAKLSH